MTREEFQNLIGRATDLLRRDGLGVIEYIEEIAWLLFLKSLDALEENRRVEAELAGRTYAPILEEDYRWGRWAKGDLTGAALMDFVNAKLFPYLQRLQGNAERERIRTVFQALGRPHTRSGYTLKDVIQVIDRIDFFNAEDVYALSMVYEELLKEMGNAAGLAGEFYTPRHLVRFMVEMAEPTSEDTVYDPGMGTGGFLVSAFEWMRERYGEGLSGEGYRALQRRFSGREKKPLTYLLGLMNLLLHGLTEADVHVGNTLTINVLDPSLPRHSLILTNPPFGGKEHKSVQQNFPYPTAATEALFLQHILRSLAPGGRAAVILPEGMLFRGGVIEEIRKELLERNRVRAVISLPPGVFEPYAGVKTNIIYIEKSRPDENTTEVVWFFDVQADGFSLTKSRRSIPENDLPETLRLWREWVKPQKEGWQEAATSEKSWTATLDQIREEGYNLTAAHYNPNPKEQLEHEPPAVLLRRLKAQHEATLDSIGDLMELVEPEGEAK